jgi:3-methyl-2-oxobutanoate hydroxymethyltransferase
MDEMVMLGRAARRGTHRAFYMIDMPLGAFQVSDEDAVRNAVRLVKETGAEAVKIEGGGPMISRARAIVAAGIPTMGHLGLTPQSATMLGGYKAQGRTAAKARQLFADALALQAAGCFAIVLEAVPAKVAERITGALRIPTIGIGAGAGCSGQVLVWHDLLGINEGRAPKFVKRFASVASEIRRGVETFAAEVRAGSYPAEEHTYPISDEEFALFESEVAPGVLVADDWL